MARQRVATPPCRCCWMSINRYAMVKNMVQQMEKVNAEYSFYPVDGAAHRLQAILDAKFDGKTVRDHSLDFCFEAMKLGESIKESR